MHSLQNLASNQLGASQIPSRGAATTRPPIRRGDSVITSISETSTQVTEQQSATVKSPDTSDTTLDSGVHGMLGTPEAQSTDGTSGKQLQEALLSTDVKRTFSRAANLIREATAVEGCMFFDASVGSFGGGTIKANMNEKAPGGFAVETKTPTETTSCSEEDPKKGSQESRSGGEDATPENCCGILGFSTRTRSSLRSHESSGEQRSFAETFLHLLLKKYPHGKIFNFENDGSVSSSDSEPTSKRHLSPTSDRNERRKMTKKKNRISREAEAASILAVLPGARSVAWFPLWDGKIRHHSTT